MTHARLIIHARARLWSRVTNYGIADACWEWTGSRNEHGYGSIRVANRLVKTHRLAWALSSGDLPDDAFVCHHCDNPPCCNPTHLYLGDYGTNSADMVRRDRQSKGTPHGDAVSRGVPKGDEHWTRRMPERVKVPTGEPWNKGKLSGHGTTARYKSGCRCDSCRFANAVYKRRFR